MHGLKGLSQAISFGVGLPVEWDLFQLIITQFSYVQTASSPSRASRICQIKTKVPRFTLLPPSHSPRHLPYRPFLELQKAPRLPSPSFRHHQLHHNLRPINRILRSPPPIKSSLTMSRIRRIKVHFPSFSLLPSTLLLLLLNSQRIQRNL